MTSAAPSVCSTTPSATSVRRDRPAVDPAGHPAVPARSARGRRRRSSTTSHELAAVGRRSPDRPQGAGQPRRHPEPAGRARRGPRAPAAGHHDRRRARPGLVGRGGPGQPGLRRDGARATCPRRSTPSPRPRTAAGWTGRRPSSRGCGPTTRSALADANLLDDAEQLIDSAVELSAAVGNDLELAELLLVSAEIDLAMDKPDEAVAARPMPAPGSPGRAATAGCTSPTASGCGPRPGSIPTTPASPTGW